MKENLYDRANRFFKGIENSDKLKKQIKEFDHVVQFDPKNGDPFYVKISQGKVDLVKEKKYSPDDELGLYITWWYGFQS